MHFEEYGLSVVGNSQIVTRYSRFFFSGDLNEACILYVVAQKKARQIGRPQAISDHIVNSHNVIRKHRGDSDIPRLHTYEHICILAADFRDADIRSQFEEQEISHQSVASSRIVGRVLESDHLDAGPLRPFDLDEL